MSPSRISLVLCVCHCPFLSSLTLHSLLSIIFLSFLLFPYLLFFSFPIPLFLQFFLYVIQTLLGRFPFIFSFYLFMKQKRLAPDELFCLERLTRRLPNCVGSSRRTSDDLCVPIDCEAELTCPHSHVDRKLKWHYHGDDSFWGSLYTGSCFIPFAFPSPHFYLLSCFQPVNFPFLPSPIATPY